MEFCGSLFPDGVLLIFFSGEGFSLKPAPADHFRWLNPGPVWAVPPREPHWRLDPGGYHRDFCFDVKTLVHAALCTGRRDFGSRLRNPFLAKTVPCGD